MEIDNTSHKIQISMKKVALFLAKGFEEVEALTPVDVLRRAKIEITTISIGNSRQVTGAHNITIMADTTFIDHNTDSYDAIILPGGMPGTHNLNAHTGLKELLFQFFKENKLVGAICAAPLILGELGLLKNKDAICYPGFENHLIGANLLNKTIVRDENIITANGVGAAIPFSLEIVEQLVGLEVAKQVAKKMLL